MNMNRPFVAMVSSVLLSGVANADIKAGEEKARLCSLFCHDNGSHDGGLAPLLEAQPALYLYVQLKAYKESRRSGGGMDINTSALSEQDMRDISEFFAAQELPPTPFRPDPAKVALGRQTAQDLKCASCHQSDYKGKDEIPGLAGQWWDYVTAQLKN